MTLALLVPFLVYGDPQYPNTSWRTTVLFVTVGALTGLSIQMLVARAREAGAFSDAIIDTAGSLVMVLRPDGTIERFNRACEQLTGRTEAEMKGGRPDELVAEHDREAVRRRLRAGDGRPTSRSRSSSSGSPPTARCASSHGSTRALSTRTARSRT